MGRARSMPPESLLREWFEADVSYTAMSERWFEMSGDRATYSAFIHRCQKYDWYVPRQMRHMGGPITPWTNIRKEHQTLHDIQMLRKEAARRAGKVFDKKWTERIDSYVRGLHEDGCVVLYDPDTIEGFHHVPREKSDTDIVRLPEGYEPPAEAAS